MNVAEYMKEISRNPKWVDENTELIHITELVGGRGREQVRALGSDPKVIASLKREILQHGGVIVPFSIEERYSTNPSTNVKVPSYHILDAHSRYRSSIQLYTDDESVSLAIPTKEEPSPPPGFVRCRKVTFENPKARTDYMLKMNQTLTRRELTEGDLEATIKKEISETESSMSTFNQSASNLEEAKKEYSKRWGITEDDAEKLVSNATKEAGGGMLTRWDDNELYDWYEKLPISHSWAHKRSDSAKESGNQKAMIIKSKGREWPNVFGKAFKYKLENPEGKLAIILSINDVKAGQTGVSLDKSRNGIINSLSSWNNLVKGKTKMTLLDLIIIVPQKTSGPKSEVVRCEDTGVDKLPAKAQDVIEVNKDGTFTVPTQIAKAAKSEK